MTQGNWAASCKLEKCSCRNTVKNSTGSWRSMARLLLCFPLLSGGIGRSRQLCLTTSRMSHVYSTFPILVRLILGIEVVAAL